MLGDGDLGPWSSVEQGLRLEMGSVLRSIQVPIKSVDGFFFDMQGSGMSCIQTASLRAH